MAGIVEVLARPAIPFPSVPGANHAAIHQVALSEWTALMKAHPAQSVQSPSYIADGIHIITDADFNHRVFRNIGCSSDFHKWHIPIKPRLTSKRNSQPARLAKRGDMRQKIALALAATAVLLLTACAPVTIARINQDPSRYYRRNVTVNGTVVTSVGLLGTGGYQIDDGTGKIYVLSRTGVPSSGSQVSVTGSVVGGAEVLGRPIGTAIREESHKLK